MKKQILIIFSILLIIVALQDFFTHKKKHKTQPAGNYVVMLSLDGFRWDYQDKADTPFLDSIEKHGVKAAGLQPVFPSKTFPNHYTIATGLYAGNHGIISNGFYVPSLKKYYSISDRQAVEDGRFYFGEPIWVTAESQGVVSASYFWVGSEAQIKGYHPRYWKKYNHTFPYYQRADTVIAWLQKPFKDRPRLICWYIDAADTYGHKYGPDSDEIKLTISSLDSIVGYFTNKLQALDIKDSVNFIIVSDHGMTQLNENKTVLLNNYIKSEWTDTVIGSNPFYLINPHKKCKDSILSSLKNVKGVFAWDKKNIPERYHLKQSERIPGIVICAQNGWNVYTDSLHKSYSKGTHGYDNTFADMNGVFYATGPAFKQNYHAEQLYNVDIYNLITTILNIKPAPNDGNLKRISPVLK
jgi:alkaline phosphatase D